MPKITVSATKSPKLKSALTIEQILNAPEINKSTHPPRNDPLEVVYNIRHNTFRYIPRSSLITQDLTSQSLLELPEDQPPLLVEGKMQIVTIPKWKRRIGFYWRTYDGLKTTLVLRTVRLPRRVWVGRNLERDPRFEELFVERC